MPKKYEITSTIHPDNPNLRQIKALKSFGTVKEGDLGGWIEKEENLSHEWDCWIFDNASVFEEARVREAAQISGNAKIFGCACISGFAKVLDYANVFDNTSVHYCSHISGNSLVFGNARIYGATLTEDVVVYGSANIHYNVKLSGKTHISFPNPLKNNDLSSIIKSSVGLFVSNSGWITGYKRIKNNRSSEYDTNFKYPEAGIVEEPNFDPDPTKSYAAGIHFSHFSYYPEKEGSRIIELQCHIDDVICCLEGKIRAKKVTVVS